MKIGHTLKMSLAANILLCAFVFGKRIYYAHSGPAPDAQQVYFDKYNQARKGVQNPLPIDTGDVVFVGTSLTEGFPLQEMFHSLKFKNRGIMGNKSCHIMSRIDEIARARPAKIFLELGVNDILAHDPLDSLEVHYQEILNSIFSGSPYTKVYVQSVFPLGGSYGREEDSVKVFDGWLKKYCLDAGLDYIDLFDTFAKNGAMMPEFTYDGVHLTAFGYTIWKHKLEGYLEDK